MVDTGVTFRKVPKIAPVEIAFKNCSYVTEAVVLGNECLLGVIPLDAMDVVVDPRRQTLGYLAARPNRGSTKPPPSSYRAGVFFLRADVSVCCFIMVRVEEELKHQRELMREGFAQVDKRLEQIDKRLDQQHLDMDQRFEQVNKRFEAMRASLDKRFDEMLRRHDQQFFWLLGFIATGVGLVIAALRYL